MTDASDTTLVAIRIDTQARIAIEDLPPEAMRSLSDRRLLICPHCGGELTLKAGPVRVHHFAHLNITTCAAVDHEPENDSHRRGKLALYHRFREGVTFAALEHHLPVTDQRADVFIETSGGRYALEFQQVNTRWSERHALYQALPVSDIWFLGQVRYSPTDLLRPIPRYDPLPVPRDVFQAASGMFRVREVEKAMLRVGPMLYYLDPDSEDVTILLGRDLAEDLEHRQAVRAYHYRLPLAACELRDGKLWTPLEPLLDAYRQYLSERSG